MYPLETHELKELALLASLPHPPKRSKPGKGKVRLNDNSSLRKLMRAARRDMLPAERMRAIQQAMRFAADHPGTHQSPAERDRRFAEAAAS